MRDVLATIAHLPAPPLQVSDFSSFLAGITHILGVFIGGEEGGRDQPDGDATEGAHDDGLTLLAQRAEEEDQDGGAHHSAEAEA